MKKLPFFLSLLVLMSFGDVKKPSGKGSPAYSVNGKSVTVYTTADQTDLRISPQGKLEFSDFPQPKETDITVFVDPTHTFQTLVGIGGALTDASAETLAKLPADKQNELLKAYYDTSSGIGYTLARTSINSCDFSSDSYVYVEDKDSLLKTFSVAHDMKYRIPLIKQAMAAAGGRLTLFVTPWTPPAWMKTNNSLVKGGSLLPQYSQVWANYYVKFINTYEKLGIPVWGLSVQNEPMATQSWESCIYTGEQEHDFIKKYLGPTLQKAGMSSKKLIAWDHNRDLMYQRASAIFNDPATSKYVWGLGYHWYETWTGAGMQFDNERRVKEAFPDKNLMFTEGCVERFKFDKINDWSLGERYGYSMINDFNNGTCGWTDWNILLDETGGPNHVGNFCFAPVIADTRDGSLHYTSSYYYIGQFSKFIRPGAKRVSCSSSRDVLSATSFLNPDGKLVVVVMNKDDKNRTFNIWIGGKAAKTESLPHSISTYVIE